MTKLCFINPSEHRRAVVYELAKNLVRKKNHEVMILQPLRRHKFIEKKSSETIHNNLEIRFFPSFFVPKINYVIPFFNKQIEILCKLLSELKCEVIQVCDYEYLTSILPIFLKKRYRVPTVLTTDALPGYSWVYGDAIVDAVAKLYTYSIGKKILNSYNAVALLYKELSEEVKTLGVPPERIYMIPNGIDFEEFGQNSDVDELRTRFSIKDDERVLLFAGRLSRVKRVEILIRLTKTLIEQEFKVKTVIVGEGPRRKDLERLSSSIKSNVIFTGYIPHDQIYKYYFLADVFVLPSISEGLPTALLEASAAGKPCVASHVNGVPDIVIHNETGFLVEKSDIKSYVQYVKVLLRDEDLSKRMGKKASGFVKENFNWDVVVDRYSAIYRRIVN